MSICKSDILKREIVYSTDKQMPVNCVTIDVSRAFEIIALNKKGVKVEKLESDGYVKEERKEFVELVGQDNINRFDKSKRKKKKNKTNRSENRPKPVEQNRQTMASESENGSEKPKNGNGEQSRLRRRQKRNQSQNSDNRKRNSETDKNQ